MAVMGRKKKAVAQGWNAINKRRSEENKPKESKKEKPISKEEHEEKIKLLKDLGLIKD